MGDERWIAWSIFIPTDYVEVSPTNTTLGQIHQRGGPAGKAENLPSFPPLIQFEQANGLYEFGYHDLEGDPKDIHVNEARWPLIPLSDMRGKWTDIILHIKFAKADGYAEVYINGEKKASVDHDLIKFTPKDFYFKYGIYNSFISRYKAAHEKMPTRIVYYDEVRIGSRRDDVDLRFNTKLRPID
jgi:hypothetical protein